MSQKITGVILAGGLGRRMGGIDKGLQELRGRPMIDWVIERFAPQVDELLINANQNVERYAAYGHRVVPDQIPDNAGPLAGLHAALSAATYPLVATVPLQVFACEMATAKGHDVDQPRNLAKSVTVE